MSNCSRSGAAKRKIAAEIAKNVEKLPKVTSFFVSASRLTTQPGQPLTSAVGGSTLKLLSATEQVSSRLSTDYCETQQVAQRIQLHAFSTQSR